MLTKITLKKAKSLIVLTVLFSVFSGSSYASADSMEKANSITEFHTVHVGPAQSPPNEPTD